jgi:uncharacterized peroxidase-related enzyme
VPHIDLPADIPGIRSLFAYRPETATPLLLLAEALLYTENTLTPGERELIASAVSSGNECRYCCDIHSAAATAHLGDDGTIVESVKADPASAPVSDKLKALLTIAGQVRETGRAVTDEAVAAAKAEGATDTEIHDTVLIAAAFCMFNRYVDGLATVRAEPDQYPALGRQIAEVGYASRIPGAVATPPS